MSERGKGDDRTDDKVRAWTERMQRSVRGRAGGGGEYRRRPRSVAVCRRRHADFLHGGSGGRRFLRHQTLASLPVMRGCTRKSHAGGGRVPVSSTQVISGVDGVAKRGRGRRADGRNPWNGERGGAFTGTPVPTDGWMDAGAKIIEVPAADDPALISSNVCSPWTPLLQLSPTSE